jgi:DNA-binding NarL/FixJ family response regulator
VERRIQVGILCGARLMRESLTRLLAKKPEIEIAIAIAPRGEVCARLLAAKPNLLIFDSSHDVLLLSDRLRKDWPHNFPKLILVAMEEDEEMLLRMVQAGVTGFVLKEASAGEVVAAVRAIAQGEIVCPQCFLKPLFEFVARQPKEALSVRRFSQSQLTRKELEMIPLITRGLTNKEIGGHLNLSEQTVRNHVHHILRKMGVENRLQIIAYYRAKDI